MKKQSDMEHGCNDDEWKTRNGSKLAKRRKAGRTRRRSHEASVQRRSYVPSSGSDSDDAAAHRRDDLRYRSRTSRNKKQQEAFSQDSRSEEDRTDTSDSGQNQRRPKPKLNKSHRAKYRSRGSEEENRFVRGKRSGREREVVHHQRSTRGKEGPSNRKYVYHSSDSEEQDSLDYTVSQLAGKCSELEHGKKLLCVKLATTTERLNNVQMQNKALLSAVYACSAHNAEVRGILGQIQTPKLLGK